MLILGDAYMGGGSFEKRSRGVFIGWGNRTGRDSVGWYDTVPVLWDGSPGRWGDDITALSLARSPSFTPRGSILVLGFAKLEYWDWPA